VEAWLENQTLGQIVARNSTTTNLQGNVMVFKLSISGTVFNDQDRNGRQGFGESGLGGRTVQLLDPETGEVLAQTTTRSDGSYRFTVPDGLELGTVQVSVVAPPGVKTTTPNPVSVTLTRGGQSRDVDFGLARTFSSSMVMSPTDTTTDPLGLDPVVV
jgi:hypothetical protein